MHWLKVFRRIFYIILNLEMNRSAMQKSLGVVAHDAGGAEILASYLLQNKLKNIRYALSGPAIRIFREKLGDIYPSSLPEVIENSDWLLTGTGWQTDFEWRAIHQAREVGKYVVSFLDHWVNYKARFQRCGKICNPNEIWIGDKYAEEIAKIEFSGITVKLVDNPYFKDFVNDVARFEEINKSVARKGVNILFVCENIDSNGFHQDDAIRFFMTNCNALRVEIQKVIIRPHPSEIMDKYAWVKEAYGRKIIFSENYALAKDVAESDIVVGCSTMAMALALKAGRRVISCIPNQRYPFTLPFEQIENLTDLI